MLLPVPPTRRDPRFLVFLRAPRSTFASSFARRMKLGKTIPRRPTGLNVLPTNWRRRSPIGQFSRPSSLPPTPGLPVSRSSQSIAFPCFSDSLPDVLHSVLESQVQALHAAAATATGSVNACGDTVAARL